MFSITKLEIECFDPIINPTTLELNTHEVLCLGSNGSGKTTFLKLIDSLFSFDFLSVLKSVGAESKPYDIRLNYQGIYNKLKYNVSVKDIKKNVSKDEMSKWETLAEINSLANNRSYTLDKLVTITINDEKHDAEYRYELTSTLGKLFIDGVEKEQVSVDEVGKFPRHKTGEVAFDMINSLTVSYALFLYDSSKSNDSDTFQFLLDMISPFERSEYISPADADKYYVFREGVEHFDLITDSSTITLYDPLDSDEEKPRRPGFYLSIGYFRRFFPGISFASQDWLSKKVMQIIKEDTKDTLVIDKNELPVLKSVCDKLGFDNLKLVYLKTGKEEDKEYLKHKFELKEVKVVSEKSEFDVKRLSFGQRRYLSLIFFLELHKSRPDLIDEPANGLHYRFLEDFYFSERKKQRFMTTQSPWVVDFLELDSANDVKSKFVLSKFEGGSFSFKNLKEKDCNIIFEARSKNLQNTGKIFSTRGYW